MKRQVELAQNYGIGGFAFYYYWFSGKKLMEKPVYNYLANPALNLPFCLHWANENWSKRWDGGNRELLMEQTFSREDFEPFAKDLLPFFRIRAISASTGGRCLSCTVRRQSARSFFARLRRI